MNPDSPPRRLFFVGLIVISVFVGVGVTSAGGGPYTGPTATTNTTSCSPTTNSTGFQNETTMGGVTGGASVVADPNTAGATATHRVTVTIGNESAGDLTGVIVDYAGTNASVALAVESLKAVTLSGRNICDDTIPSSLNGDTVMLTFGSHPHVEKGDTLSVVYGNVENPPNSGNYTIHVRINPTRDPTNLTASLKITGNGTSPQNGTAVTTHASNTPEPTEIGRNKQNTSGTTTTGSGPGFTAFVTVVAMLVVAVGIARHGRF